MIRIFFMGLFFFFLNSSFADEVWRNVSGNLDNDLYSISISPYDENVIYVGSDKAVFKSEDKGKTWQYLYTIRGENQKINFILFDPKDKETVYLATSNGLFKTKDKGKSFQRIFQKERTVFYVVKNSEGWLYLGTNNGVYLSKDEIIWERLSGIPQDTKVFSLDIHPALSRLIYAVSDWGVYRSFNKGETWERVFVSQSKEETYSEESEEENLEEEKGMVLPSFLLIDRYNPSIVYLGTTKGLFISSDSGRNWEKKEIANLGSVEIRHIVFHPQTNLFYLATSKGVFRINFHKLQAEEIYQDLPTHNIRMIAADKEGKIWAVTDKGLFKTMEVSQERIVKEEPLLEDYEFYFRDEPTIAEVQREAIRYAEVYPEKIKNWRIQSRLKAFVPELDLDYDKTVTTALGATYDRVQVGPRDWGVSLKWDLGDLIWSTDQTSIDVRSRLMVQLRDDILDEVNRLFYERRRVKLGLLLNPPQDLKERLEKQIRLEELTAGLDALTGGYFSKRLKELSQK